MQQQLHLNFEKGVRLLSQHFTISKPDSRKPVLFHVLRVGVRLYEEGYSHNVVLGGLLHDALEWSNITEEQLRKEFGDSVTNIVVANTKDRSIEDSVERLQDLARRCVECGQDALIVEAADTIDSFRHYSKTQNESEIQYGVRKAAAIFKYRPKEWNDSIFEELRKWTTTETAITNCVYRVSVKALILDDRKRFLLTKERNGLWEFPGGGLDLGELRHDCLMREIKEEMSLTITHIDKQPAYFVTAFHNSVNWRAYIFFKTTVKNLDFTPSDECTAIQFFTKEEAFKELLHPVVKEFINVYNPNDHGGKGK